MAPCNVADGQSRKDASSHEVVRAMWARAAEPSGRAACRWRRLAQGLPSSPTSSDFISGAKGLLRGSGIGGDMKGEELANVQFLAEYGFAELPILHHVTSPCRTRIFKSSRGSPDRRLPKGASVCGTGRRV